MVALDGLTIGILGVGTIASSCVRGWCGHPEAGLRPKRFVLSPRNAAKAASLQAEFGPERIEIASDNQAVLDAADVVVVAVLVPQAEAVLDPLKFEARHRVVSLMAAVGMEQLEALTSPASARCIAIPLPVVAARRGVTLMLPKDEVATGLFDALGETVAVDREADFKRLICMTFLQGDMFERHRVAMDWLVQGGVEPPAAAAYVSGLFRSMLEDTRNPGPTTFADLVAEQTPGGMNEVVVRQQRDDGSYTSILDSLDSSYDRLIAGAYDPDKTPAARRRRRQSGGATDPDQAPS